MKRAEGLHVFCGKMRLESAGCLPHIRPPGTFSPNGEKGLKLRGNRARIDFLAFEDFF